MKEKEKIFFVYPPSPTMNREDRCQQPTDDFIIIPPMPPIDMMNLSTIAKANGFETKFKDYSINHENVHDFIRDLREYKPNFLVLNIASTYLESDLSILEAAKELLNEVIVIVKGAIFNFGAYSILQKYPTIDIALKGEIESAFEEIIQYKDLNEIKGLTYQVNNKIISTPDRKLPPNIDNLPFPDRNLIDNNIYIRPDTKKPQTIIRVAKGCPNNCFCCLATPLNGSIVRYRSNELIIKEIKECIEKYNIKDFIFWSDIFNNDKNKIQNLCKLIIKENLEINFTANTRADTVDEETLNLMKQAGCNLLSMGVESSSQEILDKMGKNITIKQILDAVEMIKNAEIEIYAYYVIGLPWETKKTIEDTYNFACKLNTEYASFYTATALMGTRFYDYTKKNRLGNIEYQKPYFFPCVKSIELSMDEICEYSKKFNRNYYLRPRYIFKMAKKINSLVKFRAYYDTFLKFLRKNS